MAIIKSIWECDLCKKEMESDTSSTPKTMKNFTLKSGYDDYYGSYYICTNCIPAKYTGTKEQGTKNDYYQDFFEKFCEMIREASQ